MAGFAHGGGYEGPLAVRQGKPMRPDVARAFDHMAAAVAHGVQLLVTSGFRSAEQAVLFARRPDPKWGAPRQSPHRYGIELDLGPASAFGCSGVLRGVAPHRAATHRLGPFLRWPRRDRP